jgi:undecaprenyl diphosphate synthase
MTLPKHIAIVCDGNRRWAKRQNKPEFSGHKYAVDVTTENLINHCLKLKIPYLTFWVLSTENWKRGDTWMKEYFKLMRYFINHKLSLIAKKGAKITTLGDLSPFPKNLKNDLIKIVKDSKDNQKITINIAINYGGRDEILRAINLLLTDRDGPCHSSKPLSEKAFANYLDTANLPDPDLLIRTGENNTRLSGFMLWQLAYTQLYFTNTLFPDFTSEKLDKAISWWQTQTKNLGK